MLFEVTLEGKIVWEYVNPVTDIVETTRGEERTNRICRNCRYAPDYPGLRGLDLTPGKPIEPYLAP